MSSIKVGDKVRSYDFPDGLRTSWVEGVVAAITEPGVDCVVRLNDEAPQVVRFDDCPRYAILVTRAVWAGGESDQQGFVFPPVNGTPKLFGEVCDGVEAI